MVIENILDLPSPVGEANHLRKISFYGNATEGETISIVSGLHGDQLTSLYISSCLIRFLEDIVVGKNSELQLRSNVQIFPAVNINALESGSRLWPYDGLDMDLAFPGNNKGESSEQIAQALIRHTVDSTMALLIKTADTHYYDAPHLECFRPNRVAKKMARALGLAKARELEDNSLLKLQLFYQWTRSEIPSLIISSGTAGEINCPNADQILQGIVNLMIQTGILSPNSNGETEPKDSVHFFKSKQEQKIRNQFAGLFVASTKAGDDIQKGQKIGVVQDIFSGEIVEEIIAKEAGVLLTLRRHPLIYENELIACLVPEEKTEIWPF